MVARYPPVSVKVWGDFACFTRPEMKVERVSYPVMTPSAARGLLESIYWHPGLRWRVEQIHVLNEIRYCSILRNEVKSRASQRAAVGWEARGGGYDASADRAQRHTLGLRDVAYVVLAQPEVTSGDEGEVAKARDQFRRRVERGQCFATPYLGCREFAAGFAKPDGSERAIARSEGLGLMLWDLEYDADGAGRGKPRFFDAMLRDGVLRMPEVVGLGVG